jgi:fructose-1-phosphate kinase PfkB-like protein
MIKMNRQELFQLIGWGDMDDHLSIQQCTHVVQDMERLFPTQAMDCIAITHGKAPAYLIQRETKEWMVYEFIIPNLHQLYPQYKTLYPIGAGDAVAAGTIAVWQYLKHKKETPHVLKSGVEECLDRFQDNQMWNDEVVAFAFGLACGSASCLQEQNSVIDVQDALAIMNQITIRHLQDMDGKSALP